MIAWLSGTVRALAADSAVVDVGGVGYLVQASARTLGALSPGVAAGLLVETQVREDAITLYGFGSDAERDWFRLLTGVQGVGGRVALAILSVLTPDELARAVTLEDRASIGRANGVGPKLAMRIVTELRGKGPSPAALPGVAAIAAPRGVAAEALSALANLGFRPLDASRAVALAEVELGDGASVNDLIRVALRKAAR